MNNTHKIQHTVKYSEADSNHNMRPDHLFGHFQDITGLHSFELEIDTDTMKNTSNAFWIISKMKAKIHRAPRFGDTVTIETWPTYAKGVRFGRDFAISDGNGVLVSCRSEWCTLDCDTKRPRKVDSVHYPHDMPLRQDRADAGEFLQVKEQVDEQHLHHTHKVLFTDVDLHRHTNNIAYVRMMLNCFSLEQWASLQVEEIQVNYLSQTYYGDEIVLYKKQTDCGYYLEGKCNGVAVFCGVIVCKK